MNKHSYIINNVISDDEYFKRLYNSVLYDFKDKPRAVWNDIDYTLLRTLMMFKYRDFPDTVNLRNLELYLQTLGFAFITNKPDGVWRVFKGSFGGDKDYDYLPKTFIITNPWLNYDAELKIKWHKDDEGDGVLIFNDSLCRGLLPLMIKYSTMKVETELSLNIASILCRAPTLLTTKDDDTKANADRYLDDILEGKIGIVLDENLVQSLGLNEYKITGDMQNSIRGLIEYLQYIDSKELGLLGLNSNYNMKREAISDAEKAMNEDELQPLIDNMNLERQRGVELLNSMWENNGVVEFNSSWRDNKKEIELEQAIMEAQANENDDNKDNRDEEENNKSEINKEGEELSEDNSEDVGGGKNDSSMETGEDRSEDSSDISVNIEVNIDKDNSNKEEENEK